MEYGAIPAAVSKQASDSAELWGHLWRTLAKVYLLEYDEQGQRNTNGRMTGTAELPLSALQISGDKTQVQKIKIKQILKRMFQFSMAKMSWETFR